MNDYIAGQVWCVANAPRYQRDSWTLYFCTAGTGRFIFEDAELPYQAGDCIVIPPNIPHSHQSSGSASCLYIFAKEAELLHRHPFSIQDDGHPWLRHLFEDAVSLFHSDADARETLLPAYVLLIAQHVNSRFPAARNSQPVEEIVRSIQQNYTNPLYNLDEPLKSAPYCQDYLCRLFRQEMNTTPHKYLANLRLETAADMLCQSTGRSVTEIAHMCGYNDPLYFSRVFKKRYGVSPREYAKAAADR